MRALVTGATSGIGRAYATALAGRGYDVIITGRRAELLETVAKEISAQGVGVESIRGDLTDYDVFTALTELIRENPVDFLVNNAGAGLPGTFADSSPEATDNLRSLLTAVPSRLIGVALPGMLDASAGVIVNVGSLAGRMPVPGSSMYVAAKSYLERLSESLALELAPKNIAVQILLPGFVRTDFHRYVPDYRSKQRGKGLIRWMEPGRVVASSLAAVDTARRRLDRNGSLRPRDIIVIPGTLNRLLVVLARLMPRRVLYRAAQSRSRLV